ncbi:Protein of unknown function [Micromonospora lupini str. Lupac 08]|uniref:Uncharacterized protein n=1 Tax=Micromonospora lupini str. Lupac 08 TaxID=1150864 RepID=I0L606_9ACTN|nr:Protein of unknown function [Micromonospora lupini str. Lupac 08]
MEDIASFTPREAEHHLPASVATQISAATRVRDGQAPVYLAGGSAMPPDLIRGEGSVRGRE